VDTAVTSAIVAAAAAVLGPPITWALTGRRRESAATVELTEAQADQIRTGIYDKIVEQLRGEIGRLQGRVSELEHRLGQLDLALREKSAELVGVQAERDQLRIQLAAAHAELQAREREIGDLKAALAARQ
jgi:predicted RNase H-like nuclease (RuvC/YqgF family)